VDSGPDELLMLKYEGQLLVSLLNLGWAFLTVPPIPTKCQNREVHGHSLPEHLNTQVQTGPEVLLEHTEDEVDGSRNSEPIECV
jgi:hypothetical protein